jgi:hypothetical protein
LKESDNGSLKINRFTAAVAPNVDKDDHNSISNSDIHTTKTGDNTTTKRKSMFKPSVRFTLNKS